MALELDNDDTDGDDVNDEFAIGLNIYQRIREVKREVHRIDKDGKHGQGFAFVRHDDVTAALSGLYVKWGIDRQVSVIHQNRHANSLELMVEVSWVNVDDPKDRKTVQVFSEGVNTINKQTNVENRDGLASGKAISYAVKMAEMKNFCLVGDTTPDSEKSGGSFASAPEVAPPTSAEYEEMKELYRDCSTEAEFKAVREKMMPYSMQKKFTSEQTAELSKLDTEAKMRVKGK